MESLHYLRVLRRRWHWIAALGLLGAIVGAVSALVLDGATEAKEPTYSAIHTLYAPGLDLPPAEYETIRIISESPIVADRMAAQTGEQSFSIHSNVYVVPRVGSQTVEILATSDDQRDASDLADDYAEALLEYREVLAKESHQRAILGQANVLEGLEIQLENLERQRDEFDIDGLDGDIAKLENDIRQSEFQLDELEGSLPELGVLVTLNTTPPVPINPKALREALDNNGGLERAETIQQDNIARQSRQTKADPLPRAVLGAILLIGVGIAGVLAIDRIDPRLTTRIEAENTFGLDVIAEIPAFSRRRASSTSVISADRPLSREAEAYRRLRSTLEYLGLGSHKDTDIKVLMVTSPGPSEGKTTTLSNLAAVYAETGLRVLVINCDFRRPKVHHFLAGSQPDQRVVESDIPNIHVVPNVANQEMAHRPADVVARQREVIRNARDRFDVVLLDTAPILTTNDAIELLDSADLVLLVARMGRTDVESAFLTSEQLRRRDTTVAGVVLTAATDMPSSSRYYYYRSHLEHDANSPDPSDDPSVNTKPNDKNTDKKVTLWPNASPDSKPKDSKETAQGHDKNDSQSQNGDVGPNELPESESVQ